MRIKDEIGETFEDDFMEFDLTLVHDLLDDINNNSAPDLYQAEDLRRRTIVGMRMLTQYEGRLIKITNYLNSKIPAIRSKYAIHYTNEGKKDPTDKTRDYAFKSCPDAEPFEKTLAQATAARTVVQKKYELLSKAHYMYRDLCLRQSGMMPLDGSKNTPRSGSDDDQGSDIIVKQNSVKSWV